MRNLACILVISILIAGCDKQDRDDGERVQEKEAETVKVLPSKVVLLKAKPATEGETCAVETCSTSKEYNGPRHYNGALVIKRGTKPPPFVVFSYEDEIREIVIR